MEKKEQEKKHDFSILFSFFVCVCHIYVCVFCLWRRSKKSIHPKERKNENNNHNNNIHSNIYMNIEQATNKSKFIANKM